MKKEPQRWSIKGKIFEAPTKSEARAKAKKAFGLRRLPPGEPVTPVR